MGRRRPIWRAAKWILLGLLLFWLAELFAAFVLVRKETEVLHAKTLTMNLILAPPAFATSPTDATLDISKSGSVLLRVGERVHEVNRGSHFLKDIGVHGKLRSFALNSDGTFFTLSSGLGTIGKDGSVPTGQAVPYATHALAPSARPGAVLLFGGSNGDHRLYRGTTDGKFQLLLRGDRAIVGAADSRATQVAATKTMLVQLGGKRPVIIFKAPAETWGPIVSVAVADDGLIFFSTPDKVFAWTEGFAVSVVNNSGGLLRLKGNELFVLDAPRHLLYSLSPASMAMFRQTAP